MYLRTVHLCDAGFFFLNTKTVNTENTIILKFVGELSFLVGIIMLW